MMAYAHWGLNMTDVLARKTYHTVTPYLIVADVPRLLEFLAEAFGATERIRLARPDGSVMHAEVAIGDSIVMMGEPKGNISDACIDLPSCGRRRRGLSQSDRSGRHFSIGTDRSTPRRRTIRRRKRSVRQSLVAGNVA